MKRTALLFLIVLFAAIQLVFSQNHSLYYGVNLAGAEFGENNLPGDYGTNYLYPSEASLDYYKSKGIQLIRLPFKWERIQQSLNAPLDAAELARLKAVVDAAESRQIYVLLDIHNYGRYHDQIIGSGGVSVSSFADLWSRLANEFKNEPYIWGYDLMNEPHGLSAVPWFNIAQDAINAVRTVDPNTTIVVSGDEWSSATFWAGHSDNLKNLIDPANNLVFQAHLYFDNDWSGKYDSNYDGEGAYPNIGPERVQPFLDWLQNNNLRGFIGEYGVPGDDTRWLTVLDNFLSYISSQGVNGTYWAGGPMWGTYPLSIEPNGGDRPQMSVVQNYLITGGTPVEVDVTGISVEPESITMALGSSQALSAVISPSNASNKTVTWVSDNPSIASVDAYGNITANTEGTTSITATTVDGGFGDNCLVTVGPAPNCSWTVVGNEGEIITVIGTQDVRFGANGYFITKTVTGSIGCNATAFGEDPNIGVYKHCEICEGEVIPIPVTGISINNCPGSNLAINQTVNLTTTISPADATNQTISWSSSENSIATVDANGVVTALAEGSATITVTTNDGGFISSCDIIVDPTQTGSCSWAFAGNEGQTIPVSGTQEVRFGADGFYTTKTVTGSFTCNVSEFGEDPIIGIYKHCDVCEGISTPVAVTGVSLDNCPGSNLTISETIDLGASISPTNATNQTISWSSSDNSIATVNANGSVTTMAEGSATITVTTNDGEFTSSCNIIVDPAQTGSCTWILAGNEGQTISINGTQEVRFGADGFYTTKTVTGSFVCNASEFGEDPIIGTYKHCDVCEGVSTPIAVTGISINNCPGGNLTINETIDLNTSIFPSSATDQSVIWNSSDNSIATVDANGIVTALDYGSATITVTTNEGGFNSTCNVTIDTTQTKECTWTFSANEWETVNVDGTQEVRFGANGTFITKTVTGSIGCNASDFGNDPIIGVFKYCEVCENSSLKSAELTHISQGNKQKPGQYIYPNPVSNIVHISDARSTTKIEIYDIQGKLVMSRNGEYLDVSPLLSGIYTLTVKSNNYVNKHIMVKK